MADVRLGGERKRMEKGYKTSMGWGWGTLDEMRKEKEEGGRDSQRTKKK